MLLLLFKVDFTVFFHNYKSQLMSYLEEKTVIAKTNPILIVTINLAVLYDYVNQTFTF